MKKVGFVGAFDKTDLIIYVAKLLAENSKKILVIDYTEAGKARYIIPSMTPSKRFITEYESVDFAIGFQNEDEIKQYLETEELEYDFLLLDIDTNEKYLENKLDKIFFVTGFDNYSLKKGLEIVGKGNDKNLMTKVLFSRDMSQEEDDYLNFLSFYYAIIWDNDKIYFPYDMGDSSAIIEGQRSAKIRFRNLSELYKNGLEAIITKLDADIDKNNVRRILKNI